MIRKALVISNRVSFSSTKFDDEPSKTLVVDLYLPIKTYWHIKDLMEKADYLAASKEPTADIQNIHRRIFRESAPYALAENDRTWLHKQGGHHQS